jgi:hypothetical protein
MEHAEPVTSIAILKVINSSTISTSRVAQISVPIPRNSLDLENARIAQMDG